MPQLFNNNARALLASGISDSSTSLTVEAGRADSFPTANVGNNAVPSANNWFKATLQDSLGNVEIIYVRTRTAGSAVFSNVMRAQEGTTARSFTAGSIVGLRLTALDVQQSINITSNNNVFTGANTFAAPVTFNQSASFNSSSSFVGAATFGGAATFNGSATFNQLISGSINGNAATVTNGVYTVGNQTIGGNKTFSATTFFQDAQHYLALTSGNAIHNLDNGDFWNFSRASNLLTLVIGGSTKATFDPSGDFTASGNITANSDIRLKQDLHVIPHAMDKVRRLTGYTFTRIDSGARQTGLIAQDVERVLPEAVLQGEHLSVAYGNLVGLLVEAIKELDLELSKLKGV